LFFCLFGAKVVIFSDIICIMIKKVVSLQQNQDEDEKTMADNPVACTTSSVRSASGD
jgi:hypothetical protein